MTHWIRARAFERMSGTYVTHYECSDCGYIQRSRGTGYPLPKKCPNCNSDIEGRKR